jgi:outer membrane protein assembly factor BamE (lipoprotein component of BamABCDE complex)
MALGSDGMKRHGWGVRHGLTALALGAMMACTPIYANHGYIPDDKDLAGIQIGQDTRDTVAGFLGRPSTEGVLNDAEWFYVQSRWKTVGAHAPQEIDRQVVAISFDPAGKVSNIERFGLAQGQVVAISRRITTEPVRGRSALAQIFGNIGRVDPAKLLQK